MIRLPMFMLFWAAFVALKLVTIALGLGVVPFLWEYRDVLYARLPDWTRPWSNPEDWYGGPKTYERTSLPKWWVDKKGSGFGSFYHYHAIRNPANGLRSFEAFDLDIEMDRVKYVTPRLFSYYEPWHMRNVNADSQLDPVNTSGYVCWQGFRAGVKFVHLWPDKKTDLTITLPAIDFGDSWWKVWRWSFGWNTFVLIEAGPRHFVFKFGWRVEPRDATVAIDPDGIRVDDAGFATKLLPYRRG